MPWGLARGVGGNRSESSWRRAVQLRSIWFSLEPLSEEMEELMRWFLEVVELSKKDMREESEGWVALAVVVRSLGQRVVVEMVEREFRL